MADTIRVEALTRVEGHGGILVRFEDGRPTAVELRIFEPPRFFEALLRGRPFSDAPDLTARICGICPVAYQITACIAMESALGIEIDEPIRKLRRLLYCGEWIQSHALHMFMLHAPDFLGFHDFFQMADAFPDMVDDALALKKIGNRIMRVLGGREIHPINVKVGGFYRVPSRSEVDGLLPDLEAALPRIMEHTVELAKSVQTSISPSRILVALRHPHEYPISEGRLVSNHGMDISADEFEDRFEERQLERSTALYCTLDSMTYACGPLSRINLNFDRLGAEARETATRAGFQVPISNPFSSIVARGLEVVQATSDAIAIAREYAPPDRASVPFDVRAGSGAACTEAPRGVLFHRYALDDDGVITDAKIVPPTSQNQGAIEEDLWALAPSLPSRPKDEATRLAEQSVRNHDPCISCATHLVDLEFETRTGRTPGPTESRGD
ncbi:MAG: Ni/Fe hydrogenase subunit alpha [Myxococcota bacterium]